MKVVDYEAADATAIQQLEQGTANPDMQKRALEWIICLVCATYDMSYRPKDTHETAFHEGRRYCGNTIVKMLKLEPGKLRSKE
jgi:hypothetical protein